jgi:hypothetical protein
VKTPKKDNDAKKEKKVKTPPKKPTGKHVACGECEACKRKACKKCNPCLSKRRCANRACTNTTWVEFKSSGKSGPKKGGTDDEDSSDDADKQEAPKPKIRIRLSSGKNAAAKSSAKKQGSKRKATPQTNENGNVRKKAKHSNAKASPSSSSSSSDGSDDEEEDEEKLEEMFDVIQLQSESEKLDGTWKAARYFSTRLGPWRLPAGIESKFKDVAKIALSIMSK